MSLLRSDGSVHIHRAPLNPARHQIYGMDGKRLMRSTGAVMIMEFGAFFGALSTIDTVLWILAGLGAFVLYVIHLALLKRIGGKGGYYQAIYDRRMREQEIYPRSAPAGSRPLPIRRQQRA